jgi:hypothetical protein
MTASAAKSPPSMDCATDKHYVCVIHYVSCLWDFRHVHTVTSWVQSSGGILRTSFYWLSVSGTVFSLSPVAFLCFFSSVIWPIINVDQIYIRFILFCTYLTAVFRIISPLTTHPTLLQTHDTLHNCTSRKEYTKLHITINIYLYINPYSIRMCVCVCVCARARVNTQFLIKPRGTPETLCETLSYSNEVKKVYIKIVRKAFGLWRI